MNPWTSFGVLLVLLSGVAGVAFSGGLFVASRVVQSRDGSDGDLSSTRPEVVARTPQRTTGGSGTVYHPTTDDDEEGTYVLDGEHVSRERFLRETAHVERRDEDADWTGPPNAGPDPSRDARRDVRRSERDAIRRSNPGFRGRDLSDREVERWLKRWNL